MARMIKMRPLDIPDDENEPSGVTMLVLGAVCAASDDVATDVADEIICDSAVAPLDVAALIATGFDCDAVDVQSPNVQFGSAHAMLFWFWSRQSPPLVSCGADDPQSPNVQSGSLHRIAFWLWSRHTADVAM